MLQLDERRFNRLLAGALTAGFLLLAAAILAGLLFLNSARRSTLLVRHTYQVLDELAQLQLQLERAESGRRGYLLDRAPLRLDTYQRNAALVPATLAQLRREVQDNPEQVSRGERLQQLTVSHLDELRVAIGLARTGHFEDARSAFAASGVQGTIQSIRDLTGNMRAAEETLLQKRTAVERQTTQSLEIALATMGALFVLVSISAFWVVGKYTTDLARARDRLDRLNANLEGAVRERTSDLQRANDEIQRFAYIVSHDLRSPLVNVMGFTAELEGANKAIDALVERAERDAPDLLTDDARHAREDLSEAIGFIRSSTQKMDRLINAILTLSRQGRRVLTPEPLATDELLADIADSLTVRAEEGGATIAIEPPLPPLFHDRLAVEQIFSNLMENATKYLAHGRPGHIVVRGRSEGSRSIFEVEDNGRGIAANDLERVFELFRRSGVQDQKGEGIGLANVRALAYRLGGTVTVRSVLGEGSTFVVDLPARFIVEEQPE